MSLSLTNTDSPTVADILFSTLNNRQTQQTSLAQTAMSTGANRALKKDYAGAIREFKRAIGLDPSAETAVKAYNLLATSYIQSGQTEEAIKAYKASIQMSPTDDSAHVKLGNIYFSQKKYAEAEKEYKASVRNNPTSSTNLFSLGQAYQATGRYQDAEKTFKRVIQMSPADYGGYYALGQTYAKSGRQKDAIAEFQKVVSLKRSFNDVHVDLGYAYADLGQTEKAQGEVRYLLNQSPDKAGLVSAYMAKIAKPKIYEVYNTSGFLDRLGPRTPVAAFDVSLAAPSAAKEYSMKFIFNKSMDTGSVQNPYNWTIAKSSYGDAGGPYNWGIPAPSTDVTINPVPLSVVYDPGTLTATVSFLIRQNADATGTFDPQHIQFNFRGKDAYGNTMDKKADQYSGISKIV